MKTEKVKKNRFSMLELLIVISIIAVLAATLLPALNKVREMGTSTSCLSQVKQVTMANLQYGDDNNGMIANQNGAASYGEWTWLLTMQNNSNSPTAKGAYLPLKMLNCPKDTKPPQNPAAARINRWAGVYGMLRMSDHIYQVKWDENGQRFNERCGDFRIKMIKAKNPELDGDIIVYVLGRMRQASGIALIADSITHRDIYYGQGSYAFSPEERNVCSSSYEEGICLRHDGNANIGFADGHAQKMSPAGMRVNRPMKITETFFPVY